MVYFDNAATTRVKEEVLEAMLPVFTDNFGNASSTYTTPGQRARKALSDARRTVAAALNAEEREIFFTGGGLRAQEQEQRKPHHNHGGGASRGASHL